MWTVMLTFFLGIAGPAGIQVATVHFKTEVSAMRLVKKAEHDPHVSRVQVFKPGNKPMWGGAKLPTSFPANTDEWQS